MDYQQLKQFLQQRNATEIQDIKNEEERLSKIIQDHEKVKEGLNILPLELSTNCMVPLGKLAMMKGKLCHTNEILVYLGDGYFVKYSATEGIEFCNRRIERAEKDLEILRKEKNRLEMGESLSFPTGNCEEILEYCSEEELQNWREQHKKSQKEYRQKLVESRSTERTEAQSEDNLMKKLDELELLEELNDEYNRLEDEHPELYGEDDESEEDSDDSYIDSDDSSDEISQEMIREEIKKLDYIRQQLNKNRDPQEMWEEVSKSIVYPKPELEKTTDEVDMNVTYSEPDENEDEEEEDDPGLLEFMKQRENEASNPLAAIAQLIQKKEQKINSIVKANKDWGIKSGKESENETEQFGRALGRKISFGKSQIIEIGEENEEWGVKNKILVEELEVETEVSNDGLLEKNKIGCGEAQMRETKANEEITEGSESAKIYFQHSEVESTFSESGNDVVGSPKDICKAFINKKSILRRSPDDNFDNESEINAYKKINEAKPLVGDDIVVEDVKEKTGLASSVNTAKAEKRPMSEFRKKREQKLNKS